MHTVGRALTLLCTFVWTIAISAPPDPPSAPEPAQLQSLLVSGAYAELDATLATYQQAYREGVSNDQGAARAIVTLTRRDPDLRPLYDAWIVAKPDSYMAHLARGYYLTSLGRLARGSESAANTSQAQFDAMNSYFQAAMQDLETSLTLDPKPVLSYSTMIVIAMNRGMHHEATRLVNKAIALDPHVLSARINYLASLRPQWGGSLEQMQQTYLSWQSQLDARESQILSDMVESVRQHQRLEPADALVRRKQYAQAIAQYDQALQDGPLVHAYAMRGHSYLQLGQPGKALDDFNRALDIDPDSACCAFTRSSRAKAYLDLNRTNDALADLLLAAEADDEWATRQLALIYAFGRYGFKQDPLAARRWCERAAKRGDGLSMYCMGGLYHAGVGVPKDIKLAALWFEKAAQHDITDAQADLAFMLWHGQGVAANHDQAIHWWHRASKLGNVRAAKQLKTNLSTWEYFSRITLPELIDRFKARYPFLTSLFF